MEEIGIVKRIDGPRAFVAVQKQSACEKCAVGSVCKGTDGDEAGLEAVNAAGARVGDTVRVVFKAYSYLKGTLLVYGLPSLLLIVGAVIGKEYAGRFFPGADPDIVSAVAAFGLCAAGFLSIKLFTSKVEGKKEYMPVIEEVLSNK